MLYLAPWLPAGILLGVVIAFTGETPWGEALVLAFPLTQVYAFICLAAWYPSRSTPLTQSSAARVVLIHTMAAIFSSSIWQLSGAAWAFFIARVPAFGHADESFRALVPLFFAAGVAFYFLAASASYLYIAFETSRRAETRLLEAETEKALAERDLELARSIQRRLLPPAEHAGKGYSLAARNLAARWVAGDFYDFFDLPDGTVRLAIADVSGKGIAASLITATVKAVLPMIAAERSVTESLRELNRRLEAELGKREFVALLLASFDPASGRLEFANAGLPDPYLLRADAEPRALEAPMPRLPLGMRAEVDYASYELEIGRGERVLFLTDGLPEAPRPGGDPLGYAELPRLFDHEAEEPGPWLDRLLERVGELSVGELEDDQTALLLARR